MTRGVTRSSPTNKFTLSSHFAEYRRIKALFHVACITSDGSEGFLSLEIKIACTIWKMRILFPKPKFIEQPFAHKPDEDILTSIRVEILHTIPPLSGILNRAVCLRQSYVSSNDCALSRRPGRRDRLRDRQSLWKASAVWERRMGELSSDAQCTSDSNQRWKLSAQRQKKSWRAGAGTTNTDWFLGAWSMDQNLN